MNFDLIRPCPKCPFRTDVPAYLRGERAEEIARAIANGGEFACHQTTESDDEGDCFATAKSQFCAGALIAQENEGAPNQGLRIAERLGVYDPGRLDMGAPVVRSLDAFIAHHADEEEEASTCSVVEAGCLAPAGWMEGGSVIRNRDADPADMLWCEGCGEPVCTNCASDEGACAYCAEVPA